MTKTIAHALATMLLVVAPFSARAAGEVPDQAGPSSAANVASGWKGYLSTPDEEKMSMQAVSPPVTQGGAKITVMRPPQDFESAAYVSMSDSVAIYYIAKAGSIEEGQKRADDLAAQIIPELGLVEQKLDAGKASYAKSFVPANKSSLTMVNIIVAVDPFAGITTTLAFTYEK